MRDQLNVPLAEALLVQCEWSAGLLFDYLSDVGHKTTADALSKLDPSLDFDLCEILAAIVNRDSDKFKAVWSDDARARFSQTRLPGDNTLLHIAATVPNNGEIVSELLRSGLDINARTTSGVPPLLRAVWANADLAENFMATGADPTQVSLLGENALAPAAWLGHTNLVKNLLKCRASAVLTDSNNGHPLIWAATKGFYEIVSAILDVYPGDVDTPTGQYGLGSEDPVFSASAPDVPALVRYQRQQIVISEHLGRTALIAAATAGHADVVKLIIERGAHPNRAVRDGWQALHVISGYSDATTEVVSALLEGGADINAQNDSGQSPLICAVAANRPDLASALMDAGADPDIANKDGYTALHGKRRPPPTFLAAS